MLTQMFNNSPLEQNGVSRYIPVSVHDTRESILVIGPTTIRGLFSSFQVDSTAVINQCHVAPASGGGQDVTRADLTGKTLHNPIEYVPPSNFAISYLDIASGQIIVKGF